MLPALPGGGLLPRDLSTGGLDGNADVTIKPVVSPSSSMVRDDRLDRSCEEFASVIKESLPACK